MHGATCRPLHNTKNTYTDRYIPNPTKVCATRTPTRKTKLAVPKESHEPVASGADHDADKDGHAHQRYKNVDEHEPIFTCDERMRGDGDVLAKDSRDDCKHTERKRSHHEQDLELDHAVAHGVHVDVYEGLHVCDVLPQALQLVLACICTTTCMEKKSEVKKREVKNSERVIGCNAPRRCIDSR